MSTILEKPSVREEGMSTILEKDPLNLSLRYWHLCCTHERIQVSQELSVTLTTLNDWQNH
jgi:hypothetical protein